MIFAQNGFPVLGGIVDIEYKEWGGFPLVYFNWSVTMIQLMICYSLLPEAGLLQRPTSWPVTALSPPLWSITI